jgi:hypothetical protein
MSFSRNWVSSKTGLGLLGLDYLPQEEVVIIRVSLSCTLVAHAYNPSYSGGRDQEDRGSKPAWVNSSRGPYLKKTLHTYTYTHTTFTKKAGGEAQGLGPEFIPQNCTKTNSQPSCSFSHICSSAHAHFLSAFLPWEDAARVPYQKPIRCWQHAFEFPCLQNWARTNLFSLGSTQSHVFCCCNKK